MSGPAEILAASSMFAGMSDLELNAVGAFLEPIRIHAREMVFREGERGSCMYVVRTGKAAAYVLQQDGSQRCIGRYGPGDFFGEMAVIEDAPRAASCVSETDVELLMLEALDFYRIVYEHPMIGVRMAQAMVSVMVGWLSETAGFLDEMVRWGETARKRAITDSLTGLFNRRFLEEVMLSRLSHAGEGGRRASLLMMDLDGFHGVNERFGTEAGDAALGLTGAAIGNIVEGIADAGIAARLSGDEFAVLLEARREEEALAVAEEIRAAISALPIEFKTGSEALPESGKLTISAGVAMAMQVREKPATLFERADAALLEAKRSGRDCVKLNRCDGGVQ
jgi:diguanylate cyclase (GGDEF)-like protein